MNLEILVATMSQKNFDIINKMRITSDAIIINQTDCHDYNEIKCNNHLIKFYSFKEKGVGLSRNNALMRSNADICLFADDDVEYEKGYKDIIIKEFINHPYADVIIFNVPSTNSDPRQKDYIAKKWKRLHLFNCFRHGTFRVAIRTEKIKQNNIFFSVLFGGGSKYSAGEDSLFISDCIRKKLKVYESEKIIGYVSHETSTWFEGYTEKYFIDKGAFYACFTKSFPFLWCLQFAIRRKNLYIKEIDFIKACYLMKQGIKLIRKG